MRKEQLNQQSTEYWRLLNEQTDEELVRTLVDGGQDALTVLLDRYHRLVYSVALRIMHDPGDAGGSGLVRPNCYMIIDHMTSSDVALTESSAVRAVFQCDGAFVRVQFIVDNRHVGRVATFSRSEAADLGARIVKTGFWDEFPVANVTVPAVLNFGSRLRDYRVNGC